MLIRLYILCYTTPMASRERVINSVEKYRKKAGMTQEELAKDVNVTRQTIISIEKGNYVPSVLLALKISSQFNIPLEQVFMYEK
jgi:putative transcriptional regulator